MAMTDEDRRLKGLTDEEYLSEAKLSASIFTQIPTVPYDQLTQEAHTAQSEFTQIINEEVIRIEQVVQAENARIMTQLSKKEVHHSCPICLEEIPPILSCEAKISKRPVMMPCCGKFGCMDCVNDWKRRHLLSKTGEEDRLTCFCCRAFIPRNEPNWLPMAQAKEEKKAWAIRYLANAYAMGTAGLERDDMKAFRLYQQAAELGDAQACAKLARRYFHGELIHENVPQSLDLASKWAKRAADQGDEEGQFLLGLVLMDGDETYELNEEAYRLFSLAAYQGDFSIGRYKLAECYETFWAQAGGEISVNDSARKYMFLSLYWYGKASEVGGDTDSLIDMVYKLHQSMKKWHRRSYFDVEPLAGYSHVPFAVWAIRHSSGRNDHMTNFKGLVGPFKHWKTLCATCGKKGDEEKKETLKVCARCKTFHYCSKHCQVKHWKDGHKLDCKEHWIEKFFPRIRSARREGFHLTDAY
jgi:hypothetical protein